MSQIVEPNITIPYINDIPYVFNGEPVRAGKVAWLDRAQTFVEAFYTKQFWTFDFPGPLREYTDVDKDLTTFRLLISPYTRYLQAFVLTTGRGFVWLGSRETSSTEGALTDPSSYWTKLYVNNPNNSYGKRRDSHQLTYGMWYSTDYYADSDETARHLYVGNDASTTVIRDISIEIEDEGSGMDSEVYLWALAFREVPYSNTSNEVFV